MSTEQTEQITQLTQQLLAPGMHLMECKVSPTNSTTVVSVVIDSETGISIDEVGEISGKLGGLIEEGNLFTHAYNLEVSSPGLDWPLTHLWQYKKNIGRLLKIEPTEGKPLLATLDAITENTLHLQKQTQVGKKKGQVKYEPMQMALAEIKKATVEPSFK